MIITLELWHILIVITLVSFFYANSKVDRYDRYFGGVVEFTTWIVLNLIMWLIYFIIY